MKFIRNLRRSTYFVLWLVIVLAYCYLHQRCFDNPMAISRLDLLHALITNRTFSIDDYQSNTVDKAIVQGHYYCDKAPGTVFCAFPGFYAASLTLAAVKIPLESKAGWLVSSWISVGTSVGLITATGMACLFLWLKGFMPRWCALTCALTVAFGSIVFPYATMLMSHAMVVGLFSIALWCLRLGWCNTTMQNPSERKRLMVRDLIAGAACGMAIASEYSVALVAGGILLVVAFINWKRSLNVILGAVPPLLLIPIYNCICTGNPFSLTYSHEAVCVQNGTGFYGIYWPEASNLFQLLLSPRQGLFFWTPFLLLAYVGYPVLYTKSRPLFWLCYVVPLAQAAILSGYYTIIAGSTLGSRFLAPIVPLLVLPAGLGAAKMPRTAMLLAFASLAMTGMATLIDAQLPVADKNPLIHFYVPQFLAGHFIYNLGETLRLEGFWSILPLLIVASGGIWYLWHMCDPRDRLEDSRIPLFSETGVNTEEQA